MSMGYIIVTIIWRPEAGGDWFEQDWYGSDWAHALRRWRRFWGLRRSDCAEFRAFIK